MKLHASRRGTPHAIRIGMSNSKVSISKQLIRPSKMQAWVFIAGCGLSSMVGAFATALFMGPRSHCEGEHEEVSYSEEYPSLQQCRSLDIHSRLDRDVAKHWFSSGHAGTMNRATFAPTHLGRGLFGVTISGIESGSVYEEVGLKDGDAIVSVEDIPLLSANSYRLLREKFLADDNQSISMALLRGDCPAFLEIGLL